MTNQYLWDRLTATDAGLRAADSDRERIAERLRQGHTEGRLDLTEFQERLERCYAAKTFGELRAVVRDLPREDVTHGRRGLGHSRPWRLAPLIPLLLVLVVVSAATSGHHGHHEVWLWIPVVFLVWRLTWWRRRQWTGARRSPGDWL